MDKGIIYLDWEKRPAILYKTADGRLEAGFVKLNQQSKWRSANELQIYGDAYPVEEEDWLYRFRDWGLNSLPSPKDYKVEEIYTDRDEYDDKWWRNK